jgi:hypothetical protein
VTSALTEIALTAKVGMLLDEASIPISDEVKARVKFSDWIRFMWRTKANCWRSLRRKMSILR